MKRFVPALLLLPILASAYISPGAPHGFVNDFAGMLSSQAKASLERELSAFEQETGHELTVVTIATHGTDETIETYATKLFEEWGIGKKKEDDGLLLLIARDDREMRIEVGYGLEGAVTDLESSHVIRDVLTPAFKAGDYDGGVNAAMERLESDARNGAPFADSRSSSPSGTTFLFLLNHFYLVFFGLIYLGSILARSKSWWAGGIVGAIIGYLLFSFVGLLAAAACGLFFDYLVSKTYKKSKVKGANPPWWIGGNGMGGGGFSGGGGGFGGFGGGSSGGGGASGRW